jgi:hypothetical protein
MFSVLVSFAAAAIAWVTLEFVGRPLRKFFDIRGDVIRTIVEFANVRPRFEERDGSSPGEIFEEEDTQLSETDMKRLDTARDAFRALGAQLRAFAGNETWAGYVVSWLGYDPLKASSALIGLSNSVDRLNAERRSYEKSVAEALLIFRDP